MLKKCNSVFRNIILDIMFGIYSDFNPHNGTAHYGNLPYLVGNFFEDFNNDLKKIPPHVTLQK